VIILMGSGETSPTMVELHKDVVRATRGIGPVVVLDTPFGFQENADELATKIVEYFATSVGATAEVASLRSSELPLAERAAAQALLDRAGYVFAGPGSPSYAARHWAALGVREQLIGCLERGGTVAFASAASVSLGHYALPVYEIYKAGQPASWIDGLNLLSHVGLDAAVVPHWNNNDGMTHDTTCCYVGRKRLDLLRGQMAPGSVVIGVDEHTALSFNERTGAATVSGQGTARVLTAEREQVFGSGDAFDLFEAASTSRPAAAQAATSGPTATSSSTAAQAAAAPVLAPSSGVSSGLAAHDADEVVAALVQLVEQYAPGEAQDGLARALVGLGPVLQRGWVNRAEELGPFVEALVEVRREAREQKVWALADVVRNRLSESGVTLKDTPEGTSWELTS